MRELMITIGDSGLLSFLLAVFMFVLAIILLTKGRNNRLIAELIFIIGIACAVLWFGGVIIHAKLHGF